MSTKIEAVDGSIFDHEQHGIEGLAIFVPEGLTAIRPEAEDFMKQFGADLRKNETQYGHRTLGQKLKAIDYVDSRVEPINNIDDMKAQLVKMLDTFSQHGLKVIGMNGIRCDNRPDQNKRPEAYQREFIEEWVKAHPDAFDKIYLIDARGGFNR